MSRFDPFFPLTSTFFGLNSNYKYPLLQEIYVCMRSLKISYSDVMLMPTHERRIYIDLYKNELEEYEEELEEAKKNRTSGGRGSRSKTVSGEALKSSLRNNQIPQ